MRNNLKYNEIIDTLITKYDNITFLYVDELNNLWFQCGLHGKFKKTYNTLISGKFKHLCPNCARKYGCKSKNHYRWQNGWKSLDQNEVIKKCIELYPNYDFSQVEYINATTPIKVICPIHGIFMKTYADLTHKTHPQGCPKCGRDKQAKNHRVPLENLINQIKFKFPYDDLDFSKILTDEKYTGVKCITTFTCKIHGDWKDSFENLLSDINWYACPICRGKHIKLSKLAKRIKILLDKLNIEYEQEKRFPDWLRYKQPLVLDFYIPSLNLAIEVQGGQHFHFCNKYQSNINDLLLLQKKDEIKYNLCMEHNITILYYADKNEQLPDKYFNTIFTNLDDLELVIKNFV